MVRSAKRRTPKAAPKRKRKPGPRRYPPVTSTRLIGFFRRLPNLPTIGQMDRLLIEEALRRTDGNKTWAAELLDVTREGLRKKVNQILKQDDEW